MPKKGFMSRLKARFWSPYKQQAEEKSGALPADISRIEGAHNWYREMTRVYSNRQKRYDDYDQMDDFAEITTALDLWADEATFKPQDQDMVVYAEATEQGKGTVGQKKKEEIAKLVNALFSALEINDVVWGHCRSLAKYGDIFLKLVYSSNLGIHKVRMVPHPKMVERTVDPSGGLLGWQESAEMQDETKRLQEFGLNDVREKDLEKQSIVPPWNYVHGRILGTLGAGIYGDSMLEAARSVWKRLRLLEESVALYRLTKAPDRFVFRIDVGTAGEAEARRILRNYMRRFTKKRFINPSTGEYVKTYNPLSVDENIYLAVRPNSQTSIDRLPGGADVRSIVDIEYFQSKLYITLGIPQAYGPNKQNITPQRPNQALAVQDIRFSRKIERLKRSIKVAYTRLAQIHLDLLQIDNSNENFVLRMAITAPEEEIQRQEVIELRLNAAAQYASIGREIGMEPVSWGTYVLREVLKVSEKDIEEYGLEVQAPPAEGEGGGGGFF